MIADRFERQLPSALTELADPRVPDYLTDILGQTARTRQRPAWASLRRWLPMAIATTRIPAVRMPWRQLGVLALIGILIAALLAAYIGSRQRLPEPFGPAGNGLIAYSNEGDIYTVDPPTGIATAIVTGPEIDVEPGFSRDGTRLVFGRQASTDPVTYDLVVANSDGSGLRVISMDPKLTMEDSVQFTPDGRSLIVSTHDGRIDRYDLAGDATAASIGRGRFLIGEIRPPDGAQLLFDPDSTPEIDLWIMNADGSGARFLHRPRLQTDNDLAMVGWSPDGMHIAFTCSTEADADSSHICVMDADGTDMRVVGDPGSDWFETDFVWSPDSRYIAFNRWQRPAGATDHVVRPIGVVSIDGGPVRALGQAPASDGALFDWSPDGKTLLSIPARLLGSPIGARAAQPVAIDVATGDEQDMPFEITSNVSWQRIAP
jgi:dipeptidyl aminopeptidase/acylaminoacyl peptidase